MQHKILLLDELGERWGKTHIYHNLRTPADALKLLFINYPDFAEHLAISHEQGIAYQVTQVSQDLNYDDLLLPLGQHDLVITPVITGSGDVGQALLGVGLIVATGGIGSVLGLTKEAATLFGSKVLGSAVGTIGVHLALSGVSNMLAPQLSSFDQSINVGAGGYLSGPVSMEKGADGTQSYAYRGATNTVGIGKTIPVVYGQALVGSHLISSSIEVIDTSEPLMEAFEDPSPDTCKVNGNLIDIHNNELFLYEGIKVTRVDLSKKQTDYRGVRRAIDKTSINHISKSKQQICDNFRIDETGAFASEDMMIMIDFKGLHDRIGDARSTLIHGYITFKVIVESSDGDDTFLNQQLTVQGLMATTQRVRYIFGFDPVPNPANTDNLKVFIQIVDKECILTKTQMFIRRLGYKFVNNNIEV